MAATFSRRDFVRAFSAGGASALVGLHAGFARPLEGQAPRRAVPDAFASEGNPLRIPVEASPDGLLLTAAPGTADFGGIHGPAWLLNDVAPSPLLRVRRGDSFRVTLRNELPDELILHWHGLTPPEHSDGHPRLAVPQGGMYDYAFTVEGRAGTYWYHSHAHMKTAKHTALGIGGMLIVEDEEEDRLGLPSGDREIALILQDRQVDAAGVPVHTYGNVMGGYLGTEVFGNATRQPYLECDAALYRFRILNGSNARVFRLARGDSRPLLLIGNDGGLLERPVPLGFVDLAPAERADILLDLSDARVGDEMTLRSLAFQIPGGVDELVTGPDAQGAPMDLLRVRIRREVRERVRIPDRLSSVPDLDPAEAVRERTFHFATELEPFTRAIPYHMISGRTYDMDRVDERVPFDQTEIWSFTNDDAFAHPVHLHATHFRILTRTGGRGRVMPWEGGLKDTVLLYPSETVHVAVRFSAHRGLFLVHCHNLEHEDAGMMSNILVE